MSLPAITTIGLPSGPATFFEAGPSDAPAVLLLHGGGLDCASLSWRYLLPHLADDFRVIAPNWPGYGGTAPFGRPYQIADLGSWLMRFMDSVGIQRATLVGISMGGGAALWSAVHHPSRVQAIVPVGTYGVAHKAPYHALSYVLTKLPLNRVSFALMRRSRWTLRKALQSIFLDPRTLSEEIVTEVAQVLESAGSGQAFSNFQRGEMAWSGLRTALTTALRQVTQPCLFIHGRGDELVPLQSVEAAASSMPNARLEIMDAGHWPMREQPDHFNALVSDFLRTV